MAKRVVVTGCGVVSPVGIGETNFWQALVSGKSGIGAITQFDANEFDSRIAGEVNDFVLPSFILPKDIKRTPRFVQFALAAAEQAFQTSKLKDSKFDAYRAGVVVGSGVGCLEIVEREYQTLITRGPRKLSPFMIPMLITNEAAGLVAIHFKLQGPNFCTVTACASGAHGIGEAYRIILHDRADIMFAGGTEACITKLGVGGFCALKALSTRNHEPTKASRPFDNDRDGFVMAEGAGVVVLEDLEHALKRGAPIYAEICGYGATCDAYHITAPNPDGSSAAKAMQLALEEANISPDSKEEIYINAHGTSTKLNDRMETKAIKNVFGEQRDKLHISSTKSMTGHMLGAAGAVEFIVSCLSIKHKIVPPTTNYEIPDPECDLNYTPNQAVNAEIKIALSNSLGFGGHNATLLVKEYKG